MGGWATMSSLLSTTFKLLLPKLRLPLKLHSHLMVDDVIFDGVINKLLLSLQHISIKTREIDDDDDDDGLPDCSVYE